MVKPLSIVGHRSGWHFGKPSFARTPALRSILGFAVCCAIYLVASTGMLAQTAVPEGISLPTELRIKDTPGWWPTKGSAAREQFVGSPQCAGCHASKAASYTHAAMSHAAIQAKDSESLRQHNLLSLQLGPYSYRIQTTETQSSLKVNDDKSSFSADLLWAVGLGRMGQTYLYGQGGSYYESHVSFYAVPQGLDITPGQSRLVPKNLDEASGRRMSAEETQRCFGCHTTASTTGNKFDPAMLVPGVTCEACHGPGAKHVDAAKSGSEGSDETFVLNPKHLNRVDSVDFCGACHRTWEDVIVNGQTSLGVFNVRFAPYRLENSKCWKKGDARLTCVACHDPHKPLVRDSASYDSRCLACHLTRPDKNKTADHPGPACPVSDNNCVSCHMPRVEPPGLHSVFTDHWIRIVGKSTQYPD
jgi:Cytochrome c554 and c-prime